MEVQHTKLYLDLAKEPEEQQVVFIRQGEKKATVIEAHIYDHGEEADLSDVTPYFTMRHPKGALLEDKCTQVSGNVVTYEVIPQAAQEVGTCSVAYFAFMDGETVTATTHARCATRRWMRPWPTPRPRPSARTTPPRPSRTPFPEPLSLFSGPISTRRSSPSRTRSLTRGGGG